jgi:hypothetical protein
MTKNEIEALIEDKIAAFHRTLVEQGRLMPPPTPEVMQCDAECSAVDCVSGLGAFPLASSQ